MAIKKNATVKRIANERIIILYNLAKEETDPKLSKRYVKILKQIGRHYKIKLPKQIKRALCKKCNSVLIPGKSMTVRLASSKRYLVYKCTECGTERHIHY
ncbi:MAG: RNAase P [Candidatus Micrarchaeaceae archaeon]|jgi:ribonuclease P protein subunit RPR2